MLVPEVKELRGEDGRCEESQEEKATYGQVLHVLRRGAAGEGCPPNPLPSWENWDNKNKGSVVPGEEVEGDTAQEANLSAKEALLWASVSPPGKWSDNTNPAPSDLAKHPQSLLCARHCAEGTEASSLFPIDS